jgi:hypothetical protein
MGVDIAVQMRFAESGKLPFQKQLHHVRHWSIPQTKRTQFARLLIWSADRELIQLFLLRLALEKAAALMMPPAD